MLFFKSIELHGFKTFANKTVIEFLPGVTVIVGPNGCGKSNVFDAIRWALGEQSAKSMRGARMGDVIFNGSSSLKATGMARVNLLLNNLDRHLPIDFDEVCITRRLFRTGESEYLLNRANCRLKDITSLLLDTGIGTDSYSIMEQGKVDAIINSKPLERRAIFDEAAGISKYKLRKDEALNKLARTDDDLLRLADIIAEVKRQAGSLKRQASKAERYKRLSAELRSLEMELLVCRYFGFKESTCETERLYQELSGQVQGLRSELAEIGERQMQGRASADEVQLALDESQSLQFSINTELQQAIGKTALFEQRIAAYEERRGTLAAELRTVLEQTERSGSELGQLDTEMEAHAGRITALREEYRSRKAEYDALKADSDSATSEMARLRNEIQSATRARMERDNEIRVARVVEEKIAGELAETAAELTVLQEQVHALSSDHTEQQMNTEEQEQILLALKADLQSSRQGLAACEADYSRVAEELDRARRAAQETESRHKALAELQENYEGYYRGVKEVMLAAKGGVLSGLVGVVSTLIEADTEHELAIETALGAQAQDIIAERAEDGKAAIRWLKESRTGRATFLPLDLIDGRETSEHLRKVAGEPGVIGFATDLVRYDPRLRTAVQYLLGNVIVCRDLDVAVGLERRGFRTKFVTLDGDMVSSHGAMSGGVVKSLGLLHRTREVKELGTQAVQLRSKEAELAGRSEFLRSERARLRETAEKLGRSANVQEIEAARARKDLEMVAHKLDEKSQQLTKLGARRGEMEREIEVRRRAQEEGAVLLAELARRAAELESQLTEAESRATEKQQQVAEFSSQVNELMIEISTGEARLANLRDRHTQALREKERLESARASIEKEAAQLEAQREEAAQEIARLHGQTAALQARQREIEELITHENQRKEVVTLDLRKLGEREQVLHRDLNEAQNSLYEVELKRRENSVQIENITVQAQEKFALPLDEVMAAVVQQTLLQQAGPAHGNGTGNGNGNGNGHDNGNGSDGHSGEPAPAIPEDAAILEMLRKPEEIILRINELRSSIDALGPVHVGAIDEYNELNARFEFLTTQERDLISAKTQLTETIHKIDDTSKNLFSRAFTEIRENFEIVFRRLFGGGRADLVLTEENGVLESGIDIIAQPPGKKPQHISLLSGGEKALTAIALLFAIFMRKPSPFCILDEIDAPLDDKNIERFKDLVREFAHTTQFVIITHNKQTMALANTIYGVTMEEQGVSRVVSLRLDEVEESELIEEAVLV